MDGSGRARTWALLMVPAPPSWSTYLPKTQTTSPPGTWTRAQGCRLATILTGVPAGSLATSVMVTWWKARTSAPPSAMVAGVKAGASGAGSCGGAAASRVRKIVEIMVQDSSRDGALSLAHPGPRFKSIPRDCSGRRRRPSRPLQR